MQTRIHIIAIICLITYNSLFSFSDGYNYIKSNYIQSADTNKKVIDLNELGIDIVRNQLVDRILLLQGKDKKNIIKDLILVIESDKYNNVAKATAIYIIGEFKAKEAIPVLIKNIGNQFRTSFPDSWVKKNNSDDALISIGKPALKPLIRHINDCKTYDEFYLTTRAIKLIKKWNNNEFINYLNKSKKKSPEKTKEYFEKLIEKSKSWKGN